MTDIDKLKDDVIEAARDTNARCSSDSHRRLRIVLAALDEAQTPDPWALLAEASVTFHEIDEDDQDLLARLNAALVWRKENPDG